MPSLRVLPVSPILQNHCFCHARINAWWSVCCRASCNLVRKLVWEIMFLCFASASLLFHGDVILQTRCSREPAYIHWLEGMVLFKKLKKYFSCSQLSSHFRRCDCMDYCCVCFVWFLKHQLEHFEAKQNASIHNQSDPYGSRDFEAKWCVFGWKISIFKTIILSQPAVNLQRKNNPWPDT